MHSEDANTLDKLQVHKEPSAFHIEVEALMPDYKKLSSKHTRRGSFELVSLA